MHKTYTVYFIQRIFFTAPCIIQCIIQSVYFPHTLYNTVYSIQCILQSVYFSQTLYYTVYFIQCIFPTDTVLYSVFYTVYIFFRPCIIQCIDSTLHPAIYLLHVECSIDGRAPAHHFLFLPFILYLNHSYILHFLKQGNSEKPGNNFYNVQYKCLQVYMFRSAAGI